MPETLESSPVALADPPATNGAVPERMRVEIINPGWGSSGYYSADVLREAAGRFRRGTHMYIDHPTRTEEGDRPERSIRDLAGTLATDAVWERGALRADAYVYPQYRQFLAEAAPDIGISIRGQGEGEQGEAEGRRGRIIKEITAVESIDYVTRAGRGGRIVELLESVRGRDLREARNAGEWLEARFHQMVTMRLDDLFGEGHLTRDERITLSSALGDALDAWRGRVEGEAPQLYQRDVWDDPANTLESDREVRNMPEISEAELRTLREQAAAGQTLEQRVTQLEEAQQTAERERDEARTQRDRARDGLLERDARDLARDRLAAEHSTLRPSARQRVVETVLRGDVPAVEADGQRRVDRDRLHTMVDEAARAELQYLADVTGTPVVSGVGESNATNGTDLDAELEAGFAKLGLSESASKRAAAGRVSLR